MADFEVTRGSDAVLDLNVADETGTPIDLTAVTDIVFTAKRFYSDTDAEALLQKTLTDSGGIDLDGDTLGLAHIHIAADDTEPLAFYRQAFKYDAIVIRGGERSVVARGTFVVVPAVTAPEGES